MPYTIALKETVHYYIGTISFEYIKLHGPYTLT